MVKSILMMAVAAGLAGSQALAGETCAKDDGAKSCSPVQTAGCDRDTAAHMLGGSVFNGIDVSPLLAQRHNRAGVDDVRRPGFNGRAWNGSTPDASRDCYAASYGAGGEENTVIVVQESPFHLMAINPFSPVETMTADGQRMSRDVVRHLETARAKWLADRGYTGGVRTFTNDAAKPAEKSASQIKPRAIIELNPEVTRFKSKLQVNAEPVRRAPVVITSTSTQAETAKAEPAASKPQPAEAKASPAPARSVVKVAVAEAKAER